MIRYEDFLATLDAQGPQFEALRRMTKIEESWSRMRAHEGSQMYATSSQNASRRESSIGAGENRRDTQQIKMVEKKNILQEKRQERERRKTQEITLLKRTPSQVSKIRETHSFQIHMQYAKKNFFHAKIDCAVVILLYVGVEKLSCDRICRSAGLKSLCCFNFDYPVAHPLIHLTTHPLISLKRCVKILAKSSLFKQTRRCL